MFGCRGFRVRCSEGEAGKREGAGIGSSGKVDASISGPGGTGARSGPDGSVPRAGRQEGLGRRSRNAPRAGRERAGPAEQKRDPSRAVGRVTAGGAKACPGPDGSVQDRRSKNALRTGRFGLRRALPGCSMRQPASERKRSGPPQGVSAAESPRRRRRTRRSGTPRGPAPSGRGSRRRWPRCRVRPAGRRFGRRFRPDCAAAAARRPAA